MQKRALEIVEIRADEWSSVVQRHVDGLVKHKRGSPLPARFICPWVKGFHRAGTVDGVSRHTS